MSQVRAFLAIDLDDDLKPKINKIIRQFKEIDTKIKYVELQNLHLTLKFFGDIDTNGLDVLENAIADVVSEFDKQELVNAVDQVKREVSSRFDLKDSNSDINLEADKSITITTNDDMKLRNIFDILQSKLVKRNLSIKILDPQPVENALGGNVRQVYKLKKGLTQELAKKISSDIKDMKMKVQPSIQGDCVRVSGKDKDDLQKVIQMLRQNEEKYDYPLQFTNYR